jgi:hypothetical protein
MQDGGLDPPERPEPSPAGHRARLPLSLAEIRQAEAEEKAEELPDNLSGKSKGRPMEPGSRRDVRERTGVSEPEQRRIEKHVAAADAYPFMRPTLYGRAGSTIGTRAHVGVPPRNDRKRAPP